MKKGFCPLASGSKGNCIYLGTTHTKILIDAGLSRRSIERRLAEIDVDLTEINAILVTHEHTDHIQGLKMLALRMGIPVLANAETAKGIVHSLQDCPKFKVFSTGETFEFGDIQIHPFTIQHDTLDPVAFTLRIDNIKLGFCTDLGFVTTLVANRLQNCDYLYLEANHDPDLVRISKRPMIYKQRVLGRFGHLSNQACAKLLADVYHPGLKHVHLAHLSSECNTPDSALSTVRKALLPLNPAVEIGIAKQDSVSRAIYF